VLKPSYTNQFQKDLKLMIRRGRPVAKFKEAASRLISQEPLDARYRNHKLTGNFKNRWNVTWNPTGCWFTSFFGDEIIFERTGTHSDLFE